tara:strand:+ start:1505 stop:1756 length:252 start_codon:yes stop_codon:yes gene_type:complete
MTTGLVTQSIVIDFHDWIGGAGSEILDDFAPSGMVLISMGETRYNEDYRDYTVTGTYGTLSQLAAHVGVGYFPAKDEASGGGI